MKKSDVTYISGSIFVSLTALFYCCTMWFSIRLPRYYPLEHAWKWANEKGVPSQGWYGMQGFAYVAAAAVTLVAYLILSRSPMGKNTPKPATLKALGVITTLIVVVCLTYIAHHEFSKWGVFAALGS
jgi:hypothetical protein